MYEYLYIVKLTITNIKLLRYIIGSFEIFMKHIVKSIEIKEPILYATSADDLFER